MQKNFYMVNCINPLFQKVKFANKTFLASALGVSAGVMLYVTFVEIFQKSLSGFHAAGVSGDMTSGLVYVSATLCFFGGVIMMNYQKKLEES